MVARQDKSFCSLQEISITDRYCTREGTGWAKIFQANEPNRQAVLVIQKLNKIYFTTNQGRRLNSHQRKTHQVDFLTSIHKTQGYKLLKKTLLQL